MIRIVSLLLIVAASASASPSISKAHPLVGGALANPFGTVAPTYRCGGVGTQRALRISDCDGHCSLQPGSLYRAENDFVPSQ